MEERDHQIHHAAPPRLAQHPMGQDDVAVPKHLRKLSVPRPNWMVCAGIVAFSVLQINASSWVAGEVEWLQAPTSLSWDNELLKIHDARGWQGAGRVRLPTHQINSLASSNVPLQRALKLSKPLLIQHNKAWIARKIERKGKTIGVMFEFDAGRTIEHRFLAITSWRKSSRKIKRYSGRRASPELNGYRDNSQLQKMLYRSIGGIKSCYENQLKSDPKAGGRLTVSLRFKVHSKRYRVEQVNILTNEVGKSVSHCIARQLKRATLPTHANGPKQFMLEQQFVFAPN